MAADESAADADLSRQRRIRIAKRTGIWSLAVVASGLVLFLAFLALPYGAAAVMLKPVLNIVGAGPGLPEDLDLPAERSVVLAADGSEIATLSGEENRLAVDIEDVPDQVLEAVLAIEDADFYRHAGINHRAIVRALFANLRAGGTVQGASTITQQYVKNAVLTADRTVERKTTEMRYAIDLERRMSKDEILERYLNIAYFGDGVYGIATAAEYYYSKTLDELTLDEAALLAGLISSPERTNPAEDEQAAIARRDRVLTRMAEEEVISVEESTEAKDAAVVLDLSPLPPPDNPFFVEYIKRLLFEDEAIGETRDDRQQQVFGGGLRIHTTLDLELQAAAEEALSEVLTDPEGDPLGALITVEPSTGAIRALALGPKEYGPCEEDDDACPTTQVNPAVPGMGGSGRQPGSAFKPVVIAAALEEGIPRGWQEETDSETQIEGCDDYAPRNFDPQDGGDKDMYEAVAVSNNVYHAALIGRLQPDPVIEVAHRLGIPDRDLPGQCSLALGSATLFPLDLVAGFATFANEGVRCAPYPVQRIERGDEVLRDHEPDCEEALDEELAREVTDLLRQPVESGTGTAAQLDDRPVAGKTGTTDDFHDAWFVGYVPQLATAAWIGFEQPRPLEGILGVERVTGGTIPAQLWADYMRVAVEGLDVEDFGEPPPQERLSVPDAVGHDVDEVVGASDEYDFHVVVDTVEDYRPTGTVVEQEPDPGTEVARGHFLRLQVSDGTGEPPEVPDVRGLQEDDARDVLEDAGYEVEVEEEEETVTIGPDDDPEDLEPADGAVTDQDPSAGTALEPGETVTITVVRYDIEVDEPEVTIDQVRPDDDPDQEFVAIHNRGQRPVDVGGWAVVTDGDDRLVIGDGYRIRPGGSLRIHTGSGSDRQDRYYTGQGESLLDPDGGTLRLVDADGDERHRVDY